MLVREFMTTDLTSLQETASLLEAMLVFMRSRFRHLPVLRDKQLVGIVTERDVKQYVPSLMAHSGADDYNQVMEATPIARVMTRDPVTVRPDQPVFEAASTLYNRRFGCLPVVESGELVGIITTVDMLGLLVRLMQDHGLASGSSPSQA